MPITPRNRGLLRSVYDNKAAITVSSTWLNPDTLIKNKADNLLNFNSCEDCRWWSQSIANSYLIFTFDNELTIAAYSLQSTLSIYPKSWRVYYTIKDDENWQVLDYQKENTFLSVQYTTKKFHVKPTLVKKIKIIQLSSYNNNEDKYLNCFALRRVEFFGIEEKCTIQRNKKSMFPFLITLIFS